MKKYNSKFSFIICVLSLLQSIGTLRAQNEIAGYSFAGMYNGHVYYISDCTSNLFNALTAATEMGGYLVALTDLDENTFVASLVSADGAWLGLNQATFQAWINGESQSFENWDPDWFYDIYDNSYAAIYPSGYWRPFYAGQLLKYIVEFDSNPDCNNPNKTYVCHNGNTICVNNSAVQSHLDHGDYLGPCGGCNNPNSMQIVLPDIPVMDIRIEHTIQGINAESKDAESTERAFSIYPNPASNMLNVLFPDMESPSQLIIGDQHQVHAGLAPELSPNPAKDEIHINIPRSATGTTFHIYNQNNQLVWSNDFDKEMQSITIPLDSKWHNGVYLICSLINGEMVTQKLVVAR